jgi:hypothetical protein
MLCSSTDTTIFFVVKISLSFFLSIGLIVCMLTTSVEIPFFSNISAASKHSAIIDPFEIIETSDPFFKVIDSPILKL